MIKGHRRCQGVKRFTVVLQYATSMNEKHQASTSYGFFFHMTKCFWHVESPRTWQQSRKQTNKKTNNLRCIKNKQFTEWTSFLCHLLDQKWRSDCKASKTLNPQTGLESRAIMTHTCALSHANRHTARQTDTNPQERNYYPRSSVLH